MPIIIGFDVEREEKRSDKWLFLSVGCA